MPRPNRGHRLEPNDAGYYEIRWTEAGRSKRISTGARDLSEAAQFLVGWLDGQAAAAGQGALTVREAWGFYEREHIDVKTVDAAGARGVGKSLCAHLGDVLVPDLTKKVLQGYAKAHGGAPGTIHRHLALLTAALNYNAKHKRMSRDDVPLIEAPPQPPARDRWLSRDEAARLLAAADTDPDRLSRAYRFTLIALRCAARETAIETLRWDNGQVDFEARKIHFAPPGWVQTKKRRVSVAMADDLFDMLRRAHKEKVSEWVLDTPAKIDYLFEKACIAAGLSVDPKDPMKVTPHTCRHTWATWALREGRSVWDVAGVLGDTPATVQRVYGHHCPEHLRDIVQGVAEGGRLDGRNAPNERMVRPTMTDKAA